MDPTDLSDAQLDQLAQRLAPHLPTGTHGDRVVLSRRAFAAAVGGTLGASGLVALGVDPAAAQAAGQVGTSSDPVDAFVFDLDVQNGATFNGTDISGVGSLSANDINSPAVETVESYISETTEIVEIPVPSCERFRLCITELESQAAGPIGIQFSTDDGASFITADDYSYTFEQVGSDGGDGSASVDGASEIRLASVSTDNSTNKYESLDISISKPQNSDRTSASWQGEAEQFRPGRVYGAGHLSVSGAIDTLRIFEVDNGATALNSFSAFTKVVSQS